MLSPPSAQGTLTMDAGARPEQGPAPARTITRLDVSLDARQARDLIALLRRGHPDVADTIKTALAELEDGRPPS